MPWEGGEKKIVHKWEEIFKMFAQMLDKMGGGCYHREKFLRRML